MNDINSVQYRKVTKPSFFSSGNSELFQGVDAFFNYEGDDGQSPSSVLNHLNLILISFKHLTDRIQISLYQSRDFKNIMLDKIYLLYLAKIYWPCFRISTEYREPIITKGWGYYRSLFYHLDMMTKKSYEFLIDKGFIILNEEESKKNPVNFMIWTIMHYNYETVQTYWDGQPRIRIMIPPSNLNQGIREHLGKSEFTDALIELFAKGPFIRARHTVARIGQAVNWSIKAVTWLKEARKRPSKYISNEHDTSLYT